MCPPERNVLKEFYQSTKGGEWTDSSNWTEPYIDHCLWYGVTCTDDGNVTGLHLPNNGLSGKLPGGIGNLTFLEYLDLSDNDVKVSPNTP